jgi:hypothetical protein
MSIDLCNCKKYDMCDNKWFVVSLGVRYFITCLCKEWKQLKNSNKSIYWTHKVNISWYNLNIWNMSWTFGTCLKKETDFAKNSIKLQYVVSYT